MLNPLLVLLMPSFSSTLPFAAQDDLPRFAHAGKQKAGILQKLAAPAPEERIHAISIVQEEKIRESAPQLIQLLRDENPAVRAEAAFTIGKLKIKNAASRLYQLMINDPSPLVRANAMVALAELDYRGAFSAILNSLDRSDIREQAAAVKALGKFGGPKAFNQLVRMLRTGSPELRENVIEALGELGDRQVARYLYRYLDAGGSRINRAALAALTRIHPQYVQGKLPKLLESRDPELVKSALESAAAVGCPKCGPALVRLVQEAPDPVAAMAADVAAYLNFGETADAILGRLHPRPNLQFRISFLWALGRMGKMEVLPETLLTLQEPVPELRAAALRILRILRPEGLGMEDLVAPLLGDSHAFVAAEAILLLGEYGSRKWMENGLPENHRPAQLAAALQALAWVHPFPSEHLPAVRGLAKSADPVLRDTAIALLGAQRDAGAAADLAALLSSPEDRVRWEAARALALIRHPETIGTLETLSRTDPLPLVRAYALLGVCASQGASRKHFQAARQSFDAALANGDFGMAFLFALALLHDAQTDASPMEQVFTLLLSGFNSARKHEYVDLLFLFDPPAAATWRERLLQSPLPRVRARAMTWKAAYSSVPPAFRAQSKVSEKNAPLPPPESMVQAPFHVEAPRSGCHCHAGGQTTSLQEAEGLCLLAVLAALGRRACRRRRMKP